MKIKSLKKIVSESKRYDIETKKTHNFFANGVLVHNSFIQLYWDWNKEEWCVGTSGMAEAEGEVNERPGTTFARLFWETIEKYTTKEEFLSNLDKADVFIFELMTPYNIVVTPHSTSKLVLTGCRYINDLSEYTYDDLKIISERIEIPLIKSFDMNISDFGVLIRTFEGMPFSEEGYVVVDCNFNRVKVKNPAYLSAHRLKGKLGKWHIMGIIKSNETEEFIATFIERKDEVLYLHDGYNNLLRSLNMIWDELQEFIPKSIEPKEQKKYAMKVFELLDEKHKMFSGLFFQLKDGKIDNIREYLSNYDDKKLYNLLIN